MLDGQLRYRADMGAETEASLRNCEARLDDCKTSRNRAKDVVPAERSMDLESYEKPDEPS